MWTCLCCNKVNVKYYAAAVRNHAGIMDGGGEGGVGGGTLILLQHRHSRGRPRECGRVYAVTK